TPCSLTGPRRPASGRAGSPSGCAPSLSPLFFLLIPPPPTSTLFPYTTVFSLLDTNVLLAVLVVDVLLLLYRAVAIIDAYRVTALLNTWHSARDRRLGRPRVRLHPLSVAGLLAAILVDSGVHAAVAYYDC